MLTQKPDYNIGYRRLKMMFMVNMFNELEKFKIMKRFQPHARIVKSFRCRNINVDLFIFIMVFKNQLMNSTNIQSNRDISALKRDKFFVVIEILSFKVEQHCSVSPIYNEVRLCSKHNEYTATDATLITDLSC